METLTADLKDKATISVPSEAQDAPVTEANGASASSAAKKKNKKKKSASTAGKARLQKVFGKTRDGTGLASNSSGYLTIAFLYSSA